MTAVETITDEAKLFVLDRFIEQNQDAITSLIQTKHQWSFFRRFIRLRHLIDEKDCTRQAILAAHLHVNYDMTKSKLMMQFAKDVFIDFAYDTLKDKGVLQSFLDTAIPVYVTVDKHGESKVNTIQ